MTTIVPREEEPETIDVAAKLLAVVMLGTFIEKIPALEGVVELPEVKADIGNSFDAKFADGRIASLTFFKCEEEDGYYCAIDDMTLFKETGSFNRVFEEVVYYNLKVNDLLKIAEMLALQVLAFPRLEKAGE